MARLIAFGVFRPLEPGNGVVEFLLLHQVDADVVVGVAEFGVDLDGDLALGDGFVQAALKAIGPAQIGISIGRGVERDGLSVEPDGGVELLGHLQFHRFADELDGALLIFARGHIRTASLL